MVYLDRTKNLSVTTDLKSGLIPLFDEKQRLVHPESSKQLIPTGDWIQTYSGGRFWPLDPKPEDVKIEDIAHALANQCRFAGHVRKFYSIAQHSVLVSLICDRADRLWGLLHDAPEAYSCDLPRPIKYDERIKPAFKALEKKLEDAIVTHFGLPPGEPESVKAADKRLLFTERRDLLPYLEWHSDSWGMGLEAKPLPYHISPWSPEHAEAMFLKRFRELTCK